MTRWLLLLLLAGCAERPVQVAGPSILSAPLQPVASSPAALRQASGFFIDSAGLLLTAEHVASGCTRLQVAGADRRLRPARLLARDAEADIALLSVAGGPYPALNLAPAPPIGDEPLSIIGFPEASGPAPEELPATLLNPTPRAAPRHPGPAEELILDAVVQHGESGAPVLDADGDAVGLLRGYLRDPGSGAAEYGVSAPDIALGPGIARLRALLGPATPRRHSAPARPQDAVAEVFCLE